MLFFFSKFEIFPPILFTCAFGAGFLAGLATGVWTEIDDVDELWEPLSVTEPRRGYGRDAARTTWFDALGRAGEWLPDLSALDF